MNRIAKTLTLIGFLTVAGLGTAAVAGPHGGSPEGLVFQAMKDLDLTPAQREQLKSIREANKADREEMREEREKTMQVFREQLSSDKPDAKKLHALIDAREEDMMARMHGKLDTVLQVHAILTPSQRTLLAERLAEIKDDFREGHEGRGEHRGRHSR